MDGSSVDGLHHRASGVRPAGTYHRVGSLRRTESVAIEAIADILRSLAARRGDANDPNRSSNWGVAENLRESKAARKDGYAGIVPFTGSRLDIPAR